MPIYEYQCECGEGKDMLLSFQEANQLQMCKCGEVMQRKISLSSSVIKQTGNEMALDSLNSKSGGYPRKNEHRAWAQQKAFEGTQRKEKTIF